MKGTAKNTRPANKAQRESLVRVPPNKNSWIEIRPQSSKRPDWMSDSSLLPKRPPGK